MRQDRNPESDLLIIRARTTKDGLTNPSYNLGYCRRKKIQYKLHSQGGSMRRKVHAKQQCQPTDDCTDARL